MVAERCSFRGRGEGDGAVLVGDCEAGREGEGLYGVWVHVAVGTRVGGEVKRVVRSIVGGEVERDTARVEYVRKGGLGDQIRL